MITLKVPTNVGEDAKQVLVKRGQKKLGILSNAPKVKDGKLIAGSYILVKRVWDGQEDTGGAEVHFYTNGLGNHCMEVRHGEEYATYKLLADTLVWSDGPPHPSNLQLGVRICRGTGSPKP